jgi:hypothetical protein
MKLLSIFLLALIVGAALAGGKHKAPVKEEKCDEPKKAPVKQQKCEGEKCDFSGPIDDVKKVKNPANHVPVSSKKSEGTVVNADKDGIMGWDAGRTSDDWHEATDIVRERTTTTKRQQILEDSYQLKCGEDLLDCVEKTDGIAPVMDTCVEYVNEVMPDGRIVNKTITRKVCVNKSLKIKKVRKYWTKKYNLTSVSSIIAGFTKKFATELSDSELALFNSIAITDGNEFESEYNYVQVKEKDLEPVLRKVLKVFKTPLCEDDIRHLMYELKECKDEAIVKILDTKPIEVHTSDSWKVCFEVFFATCGKNIPAVQMFAWSGCKSGAFHKNLCNPKNSKIVDQIITRWLARQIYLLFTCKDAPEKKSCMCKEKKN